MSKSKSLFSQDPRDLRPKIRAALKQEITVDELAEILLNGDWDFVDPDRKMNKSPDDIKDFLEGQTVQVAMWSGLSPGRRNLMQMICDAYCRWIHDQREDA